MTCSVPIVSIYLFIFAMTGFKQQRGHFELVSVLAGVVIISLGCESFLSTTVSCAFHVVLTHPPVRKGHIWQLLTDMPD